MITIQELYKYYDKKAVLSNINLRFEMGKTYGIVGRNGAGKSTLFKCIAGLETHDGIIDRAPEASAALTGYLPAEPYFLPFMTGREYIRLLTNARQIQIEDDNALNIFDLPLDEYAANYSTGMKKKLAIMAVLAQKNQLLIFDEPFNGVDVQSNVLIHAILEKLQQAGRTILISSHIFSTLRDICDEIIVLDGGKWVKQVGREDFEALEQETRQIIIGNKIEQLSKLI